MDQSTMEDNQILYWLGGLASVLGLSEFYRRLVISEITQNTQHKKVVEMLESISKVEEDLEDTLLHPDDTSFGTKWLKAEVEQIKEGISRLERMLERINK